jgi:phosphomannomutase
MPVRRVATLDGIKLFVEDVAAPANSADAWLLFRASGTEPLLRVYSEAGSPESVKRLLDAGVAFAKR